MRRAAAASATVALGAVACGALGGVGLAQSPNGGAAAAAQYQYGKATICHHAGPHGKRVTISVSRNALPAHMRHGDDMGACTSATSQAQKRKAGARREAAKREARADAKATARAEAKAEARAEAKAKADARAAEKAEAKAEKAEAKAEKAEAKAEKAEAKADETEGESKGRGAAKEKTAGEQASAAPPAPAPDTAREDKGGRPPEHGNGKGKGQ
jgi:hypothetical protein